jgi:hypothetical protein
MFGSGDMGIYQQLLGSVSEIQRKEAAAHATIG